MGFSEDIVGCKSDADVLDAYTEEVEMKDYIY